jgi:hypothetical protein
MPNKMMDSLSKDSPPQSVQDAISEEMKICMSLPTPEGTVNQQKYCAGKAYGMARSKTGKPLDEGGIQ